MTRFLQLVQTDALAQGALVGLAVVVLLTIGLFMFLITRRDKSRT